MVMVHKQRRRSDPCRQAQPGRKDYRDTRSISIKSADELADLTVCLCGRHVPDYEPFTGYRWGREGVVMPIGNRLCPACFGSGDWEEFAHYGLTTLNDLARSYDMWLGDFGDGDISPLTVAAVRLQVDTIYLAHHLWVSGSADPIGEAVSKYNTIAENELRKVVQIEEDDQ